MEQPTVAVCIPTYNQAKFLEEAVLSACRQDYDNLQVWVSDDASADDTSEVMARLCKQWPQVRYHRQPINMGIAENSSWLLRQPQTDLLVRLDSDDLLAPGYIRTLAPLLEQYTDAGYAHTSIQLIDDQGRHQQVRRLIRSTGYQDADAALRASVSGYRTAGNILMFRTEALKRLNFYEGRPEFVEDYDLSIRMADAGYGNVYAEDVLASYRIWTDDGQKRLKRKHLQLTGYIRIFEESLTPAFQRRGWNTRLLEKQRHLLARGHASYCYSSFFSQDERAELTSLLLQLGDSTTLRLQLIALKHGLAGPFNFYNRVQGIVRTLVKAIVVQMRLRKQKSFS